MDSVKPFSPETTRKILCHLQQPAVFMNMTHGWPVLCWTAEHLSGCLGDKLVRFRLGRKEETNKVQFETQCSYIEAKLADFLSWTQGQDAMDVGPFFEYPKSKYWAYADYKYISMLFQDQPSMFEDVKWSEFGFEGRNGSASTLWIGTEGANTPCHQDSYGCNLVLQVQGRKRWHLFPPGDTVKLYPTRIPYEESSVFSQVDVVHPDLNRFPAFQGAHAYVVTLEPGQVLYVPRHWWHYVESVDPITVSVNSWIEMEADDIARVNEAVTKAVVCALKSASGDCDTDDWLNPTEDGVGTHTENMQYVNLALSACAQRGLCYSELTQDRTDSHPVKRDSRGQMRKRSNLIGDSPAFRVPFGPHLSPVLCQQDPEGGSDTAQRSKHASAATSRGTDARIDALTQCSPPHDSPAGRSDDSPRDYEEAAHPAITTNDLLDCLVHPDVMASVTRLLLERHTGSHRNITQS